VALDAINDGATRVLVVDDQPLNLKLAQRVLEIEGYDVLAAASAEEAERAVEEFSPRLIVMDLHMPGMDGLELTRRLKADPSTRDVVIVACTAAAMKRDQDDALEAGCDGYVSKPVDTRSFARFIAAHLPDARRAA
jgi:CheY-like chemotaxis protein